MKLEHCEDIRVSTLREYLEARGAGLELAAVFDDDVRRVPVHLVKMTPGSLGSVDWSPPIGESLEESPEQLRASARPVAYGKREIIELTPKESAVFADALDSA